jgi:hypothetical protein
MTNDHPVYDVLHAELETVAKTLKDAADAYIAARDHYRRLADVTREAYCIDEWGVPYTVKRELHGWDRSYQLVALYGDGGALYRHNDWRGSKDTHYWALRSPDGEVTCADRGYHQSGPVAAPEGRYKWLNDRQPVSVKLPRYTSITSGL